MALIWARRLGGAHYALRSAGATRRLYRNGVLHTAWNPRRPLTGSVWDLLFLPALFLPEGAVRRVLVLGVGGGAVIRLFQRHLAPEHIVGVDLDPVHLRLAERVFGVGGPGVRLVCADARRHLARDRSRYDVIVEDVFVEHEGVPRRALHGDAAWLRRLAARLSPQGVLVVNHGDAAEAAASLPALAGFAEVYRLSTPGLANRVLAAFPEPACRARYRRRSAGFGAALRARCRRIGRRPA